jgi:hypothetical protein
VSIRRASASTASNGFPKSTTLWDQSTNAATFDCLGVINVGSGNATKISFAGIPQNYSHLQIRYFAQSNRATYTVEDFFVQFNEVTSSGYYSSHVLYGNGSSATGSNFGTTYGSFFMPFACSSQIAGTAVFGAGIIDLPDYTSTNKYKTIKAIGGFESNGTAGGGYYGDIAKFSGNFRSGSAIQKIDITCNSTFLNYSQFALYGIK